MIDRKTVTKFKGALTRAERSGNLRNVIAVCDAAFQEFEDNGYPDCWGRWGNARADAYADLYYYRLAR